MNNSTGMIAILGVCIIVLMIGFMGKKVEWLVNFILRSVMGTILIYVINLVLAAQQIGITVGINVLTILTSGLLGFPGVFALYGIQFFENL